MLLLQHGPSSSFVSTSAHSDWHSSYIQPKFLSVTFDRTLSFGSHVRFLLTGSGAARKKKLGAKMTSHLMTSYYQWRNYVPCARGEGGGGYFVSPTKIVKNKAYYLFFYDNDKAFV